MLTLFGFLGFLTAADQDHHGLRRAPGTPAVHPRTGDFDPAQHPRRICLPVPACLVRALRDPAVLHRDRRDVFDISGDAGGLGALSGLLHLHGQAAHLISQHSQAAKILAFVFIAFTAILILTFSATRISGEMGPTGLAIADRTLSSRSTLVTLRVLLVVSRSHPRSASSGSATWAPKPYGSSASKRPKRKLFGPDPEHTTPSIGFGAIRRPKA